MIYRTSLPHTPIKRTRRISPVVASAPVSIPFFVFERTPKLFTAATPLPALATVRRNGTTFLASITASKDFNGHLFARVQFADSVPLWTNAANVVEVV